MYIIHPKKKYHSRYESGKFIFSKLINLDKTFYRKVIYMCFQKCHAIMYACIWLMVVSSFGRFMQERKLVKKSVH